MDYSQIEGMARGGIAFFADSSREMKLIKIGESGFDSNGYEIPAKETAYAILGATRRPKAKEVDGDTIRASDILGIFNNDYEIAQGDFVEIDGVRYVVTDARPVQSSLVPVAYRPVLRRVAVNG